VQQKPVKKSTQPKQLPKKPVLPKQVLQKKQLAKPKALEKPMPAPKPVAKPVPKKEPVAKPEKIAPILSLQEQEDVKNLVSVLVPEKNNFSKQQIMQVILEKGYSKVIADEVIKKLYG